jgi:protein-L-isoaspartate O-methyltransferase
LEERGKPVIVMAPAEEVPHLIRELDPRGTVIFPEGIKNRSQANELLELVTSK